MLLPLESKLKMAACFRTVPQKKIPAVNMSSCPRTHFESVFCCKEAVLLCRRVPLVNYLPTPPPPPAARWRRPSRTSGPRPCPAARRGLCSSPTCRKRPPRWRPRHTDSQRTSGEGLEDRGGEKVAVTNKLCKLLCDWPKKLSTSKVQRYSFYMNMTEV